MLKSYPNQIEAFCFSAKPAALHKTEQGHFRLGTRLICTGTQDRARTGQAENQINMYWCHDMSTASCYSSDL
jgi:hypothetical protein